MARVDLDSIQASVARPRVASAYAYLLGMYLGDGDLVVSAGGAGVLRITLDVAHPNVVSECRAVVDAVAAPARARLRLKAGCNAVVVSCASYAWSALIPQHGVGRKHDRRIRLASWQHAIVASHPGLFVRGLIHSDGCRTENRFSVALPSGRVGQYAYPRYFFSNLSADIRELFCDACDRLGVRWTQSNHRNISVAQRRSVAILDEHVGPKT
jgi:RNase P subunit RPR2